MPSPYAPPLSGGHGGLDDRIIREAMTQGPTYARSRQGTRWHRVRSGSLWIAAWRPDELRECYTAWCGPAVGNNQSGPPLLTDDPPADEPLCGTCEGRYTALDPDHRWLFTPRSLDTPKVCPGSGREAESLWVPTRSHRVGICLVCGNPEPVRYGGGPYRGYVALRSHPPGPGLVPGCPFHAWKQLTVTQGPDGNATAACRCDTTRRDL